MPSARAFLQLVRAPNLFTAVSNVVAGFTLMAALDDSQFAHPPWHRLGILALVSAALYASGAVFNDCLDFEHDCRFRPERPIPSGAISLGRAYLLGFGLVVAAVGGAMLLGATTVLFTGLLITATWFYNGVMKRFMLPGALSMGLCRALNILLGMSTGMSLGSYRVNPVIVWAPLLLGVYTAIVTAASHYEDNPAGRGGPWVLFGAAAGLPLTLLGVAVKVVTELPGRALLALLIPATAAVFITALMQVTFASVRRAIALSVMLVIVFDAAVVMGTRNAPLWLGLVTLLLLAPAGLLARAISAS